MTKILEKMDGKRIVLICENNTDVVGETSIRFVGSIKEIITKCCVMVPKSCFSEQNVIHIMLPEGFDINEIKTIEDIEFV